MNRRSSYGLAAGVFVAITLAACANAGGPTPPSATSVAATAQIARPTAEAAATQVAPTAQAAGTQVVAQILATVSASAPIRINNVQASTGDSTVVIENTSGASVDLTGWQLQVGGASAALPSGMTVAPGATVTLHTGSGTSTPTDVYLGAQAQNITTSLKPGAQVVLQSPSGPVSAFNVPGA